MTKLKIMKTTILLVFFLLVSFAGVMAQQAIVKGTIIDDSGETLPGVNVVVEGTTRGVISNLNGMFEIKVDDLSRDVLIFSFIGYKSQKITLKGQSKLDIKLQSSLTQLDEVVAVGYGTMKKKDLTGSIVSVNMDDLEKIPVANVAQAMAGKVSGVQITSSEGQPGAGISIRVRGGGSITQSNEPLYIIDGFPSEDGLSTLDPSDIESIDILKDASSTAIYGARGANGVVVIKTKGGAVEKTSVNFDSYFGIKQLSRSLDVLSPLDFVILDYERETLGLPYDEDGEMTDAYSLFVERYGEWEDIEQNYADRLGVDWQNEAFGENAFTQNYKLSVTGGTDAVKYNMAYSRFEDEGLMVQSGFERNNAKLNLNIKANDRLNVVANVNYSEQKTYGNGTSTGGGTFNRMSHIILYRPTIGIDGNDQDLVDLDEDPELVSESGNVMQNPIVSAYAEHRQNERKTLSTNASFEYKLTDQLTLKVLGGIRNQFRRTESFDGSRSITAKRTNIRGSLRSDEYSGWNNSNVLQYQNQFNDHKLDIMLGNEQVYNESKWFKAGSAGFPNDDIGLADLSLGALPNVPESYESDDMLISFFGRGFYSYKSKYLFSVTFRADGSSRFGAGNKWGYFPAGSFAWRLSEEDFIKDMNVFSNLKLRLSYGEAGNNRIGNYKSLATLSSVTHPFNNTTNSGMASDRLPNPNLKWETTITNNLGLETGFLDQRIQLTAEFYKNTTTDLLLNATIPYTSGFSNMFMNIGKTQNTGFELSISTDNIKTKNFRWNTDFNISFNKSKIKSLIDGQESFLASSEWGGINDNDYIVQIGRAVGQMYGYITDGLYQVDDFIYNQADQTYTVKEGVAYDPNNSPQPGYWKYKDVAGAFDENGNPVADGKIDANDRTIIGDANPVHFGGLTNTFTYKNFDLSIFMNWSVGNDVYNASKLFYSLGDRKNKNGLSELTDRWMTIDKDGMQVTDPAKLAEMNQGKTIARVDQLNQNDIRLHSWAIEDGSFLRINNVSLGYRIPKKILKKASINSCRVYATVNNLHTFTSYSGFDPEASTRNSSGLTPGVDYGAYPRNTSYVFGLNVSF